MTHPCLAYGFFSTILCYPALSLPLISLGEMLLLLTFFVIGFINAIWHGLCHIATESTTGSHMTSESSHTNDSETPFFRFQPLYDFIFHDFHQIFLMRLFFSMSNFRLSFHHSFSPIRRTVLTDYNCKCGPG